MHLWCKPVVTVHIELQSERRPSRNTQIAESKITINEIEVVVKTFTAVKFQEGPSTLLVMPWPVAVATLHGWENMDQPFCNLLWFDELLDTIIFSECPYFADEFNFNSCFFGNRFCRITNSFCQRLTEFLVIEYLYLICIKLACHSIRMTPRRNISLDNHTVIAGENSSNFRSISFRDKCHSKNHLCFFCSLPQITQHSNTFPVYPG